MASTILQSSFDYSMLEESKRAFIKARAEAIKLRMKRTAVDIIAVGQDLIAIKRELKHGQFKDWLRAEFDMSYDTAVNFMQVARRFSGEIENGNFPFLSASVLYELASPKMPDQVVHGVLSGIIDPTLEAIRKAKKEQRKKELENRPATIVAMARMRAGIPLLIPPGVQPDEELKRREIIKINRTLAVNMQKLLQHVSEVHTDNLRSLGMTGTLETLREELLAAVQLLDEILQQVN